MTESQKVTEQRNLTTASGRTWLVSGGILALLSAVLLWFMRDLEPVGAATTALVALVVLYLLMIAVRYGISNHRVRLWMLATLTIGIALTFLITASIIILGYQG